MTFDPQSHTITLPSGEVVPTAEACRRYRINIPTVELYQGLQTYADRDMQPDVITVTTLLTDAIPGAHNKADGYDIDSDTIHDAYVYLCDAIAEVIGRDLMGDDLDRLWADFRRDVCRARGDSADRYVVRSKRYFAQQAACYTDTDANNRGFVHVYQESADLEPEKARMFAAALLAAAHEAKTL